MKFGLLSIILHFDIKLNVSHYDSLLYTIITNLILITIWNFNLPKSVKDLWKLDAKFVTA